MSKFATFTTLFLLSTTLLTSALPQGSPNPDPSIPVIDGGPDTNPGANDTAISLTTKAPLTDQGAKDRMGNQVTDSGAKDGIPVAKSSKQRGKNQIPKSGANDGVPLADSNAVEGADLAPITGADNQGGDQATTGGANNKGEDQAAKNGLDNQDGGPATTGGVKTQGGDQTSGGGIPDGYQMGFATQDHEPAGQQSICTTNCKLANPFTNTAGPSSLPPGVFAAAINPALGGAPDNCGPCGSCYAIRTTHQPYCKADPYDPACGTPGGPPNQGGPDEIKILITNHCPDCDNVPGHFDINEAPAGWDNPRIYWKKLADEECL